MKALTIILAVLSLSACTTNPKNIGAAYVSPLKYADYDCDQLVIEASRVEQKVNDLFGHLKKENSKDKWAVGVGMVIFWPALLFTAGNDSAKETEYAQLKGEYEAIREVQVQKKCVLKKMSVPSAKT